MPRARRRFAFVEQADPRGLVCLMRAYVESRRVRGAAERHAQGLEWTLSHFIVWCHERAVLRADEVTKPMIERFQRHLFHFRRADGQPLTIRTQYQRMQVVRLFFRWLVRGNYLLSNPASEIELPRLPTQLPREILSREEVERILNQPDVKTALGLRDRAILETLYSTGLRRKEAAHLSVWDVGFDSGTVRVREGKGRKDRTVPIGERALEWLDTYLRKARPHLVIEPDDQRLFLSYKGTGLAIEVLGDLVKKHMRGAGIHKVGACHLFRHTAATLMLDNGADIRFIQEFLGHAKLDTTQIYTRVSIQKLKAVHAATHPGAKLRPDGPAVEDRESLAADDGGDEAEDRPGAAQSRPNKDSQGKP